MTDFIKFLGTAGARFVMIRQLRASGGLWISSNGTNVLVDPGPGSLVRCNSSRPRLDPATLDGIILTHKHIDHTGDINVMIEAMTGGGFKKRGIVVCPQDVLDESVILRYARALPERIDILKAGKRYRIKDLTFTASGRLIHPAQTYGFTCTIGKTSVALLPDTKYFPGMEKFFKAEVLIASVVFFEPRPAVEHLSLPEAEELIKRIKPKKAILTHFGMTMLTAKPPVQAQAMSKRLGIEIVAARDGMTVKLQ